MSTFAEFFEHPSQIATRSDVEIEVYLVGHADAGELRLQLFKFNCQNTRTPDERPKKN